MLANVDKLYNYVNLELISPFSKIGTDFFIVINGSKAYICTPNVDLNQFNRVGAHLYHFVNNVVVKKSFKLRRVRQDDYINIETLLYKYIITRQLVLVDA